MDPAAPPRPESDAPPRPSRWFERASAMLLIAAAAALTYTAMPALLRLAVGLGAAEQGPAPVRRAHPAQAQPDEPERVDLDLDRDLEPDDPAGSAIEAPARAGLARVPLALRDKPSEAGRLIGEIPAGRLVAIWRESAGWVLIVSGTDDDMVAGWVKKSGIAVR
jgi:hypothetical protein